MVCCDIVFTVVDLVVGRRFLVVVVVVVVVVVGVIVVVAVELVVVVVLLFAFASILSACSTALAPTLAVASISVGCVILMVTPFLSVLRCSTYFFKCQMRRYIRE